MNSLHQQVFAAIEALPRPVSMQDATNAGLDVIPAQDGRAREQWQAWMLTNGAQLLQKLNRGAE